MASGTQWFISVSFRRRRRCADLMQQGKAIRNTPVLDQLACAKVAKYRSQRSCRNADRHRSPPASHQTVSSVSTNASKGERQAFDVAASVCDLGFKYHRSRQVCRRHILVPQKALGANLVCKPTNRVRETALDDLKISRLDFVKIASPNAWPRPSSTRSNRRTTPLALATDNTRPSSPRMATVASQLR